MTGWTFARALIYAAGLAASALALAGLAEFDPATGAFDLGEFNLYAAAGALAGTGSSGLALLAVLRKWGAKK